MNMRIFNPELLQGKVALITGGGSGICLGIAKAFAAHGAKTVITSRSLERLEAAAASIESESKQDCLPLAADVRDADKVREVFSKTIDRFSKIDIVINGAAGNFLAPAEKLSPNGYRTVFEIDALGTFIVSKAAYDAGLKDHGGTILNISATLQYVGTSMQIHAASAKAAVDVQTKTLAVEWGPKGIRVNAIAPGPIAGTEGMDRLAPKDALERIKTKNPLGRLGEIDEIANAALFLVSPAASFINGEILVVDGGQWLNASHIA